MRKSFCFVMLAMALLAVACGDDNNESELLPVTPEVDESEPQPAVHEEMQRVGLYVLCEGNMNSERAQLDYLDVVSGQYVADVFHPANPQWEGPLGDVGNDVKQWGNQLWVVMNNSHRVEVLDAQTARHRGRVEMPCPRYVAFHEGYAYVSAYEARSIDEWEIKGKVYKIDTLTLRVVATCTVGYQPEQLCVVGKRLYVANSGGYKGNKGHGFDQTVSEIDLDTFQEVAHIHVAPNLYRLHADKQGHLWAVSYGVRSTRQPARIYHVQPDAQGIMALADSIDVPAVDIALRGDSLCYLATTVVSRQRVNTLGVVSTVTRQSLAEQLLSEDVARQITLPYGLLLHPETGDFYVMDATNYVSAGQLFHFNHRGELLQRYETGDIPGHACWLLHTSSPMIH